MLHVIKNTDQTSVEHGTTVDGKKHAPLVMPEMLF